MITLVDSAMRKVSCDIIDFDYKVYEPIYSCFKRRYVIIEIHYLKEKYSVEVNNHYLRIDDIEDWCINLVERITARGLEVCEARSEALINSSELAIS
tara:strand:- start:41 stop:331 length:291 start_codon:yes stop_codon:yes gene_type:complete